MKFSVRNGKNKQKLKKKEVNKMAIVLCTLEMGENGNKTCPQLGKCPEQTKYGCPKKTITETDKLKAAEAEVIRVRTMMDMKKEGLPVPEVQTPVETKPKLKQKPK